MAAPKTWKDRPEPFVDGKVHAKVAVVDGARAFITSANLTGHALEKNMEAGVLINGGPVPKTLADHLQALIDVPATQRLVREPRSGSICFAFPRQRLPRSHR